MKVSKYVFLFFCGNVFVCNAQVDSLSYPKNENTVLDEMVITAQFEPQSIKKSVHNVRVISKEDIQNLAANNLGDVLNQYLNISINTNDQTGKSSVSLFGLDAQYFKILVDNIPIVSDTGLGTNIDLTQINLNNVERIEIIEGAMGVSHGANAVTGILNIITKKSSKYDWEVLTSVQEETVGNEFGFFNKGKHIQNLKLAHNLSDHWYITVGGNRNDFRGFFDDKQGKDYLQNDSRRGTKQLPKNQLTTDATIAYQKNETRLFYKFDYFNEIVSYYNPVVIALDNYPFPSTYYANDKRFISNRFFHHLNYYGKIINDITFNGSVSYQTQQRDEERFYYYILDKDEQNNSKEEYQSKKVLYATGSFTNFTNNKKVDFQLGYEFVNEKGFANSTSGIFKDEDKQAVNIDKRLENYDVYAVAEINFNDKFSVRPGVRYSFQSMFNDQFSYSFGARYLFKHQIEARLSAGLAFRTPNFSELYTYMVDSNHNIQGNPDLTPEKSRYTEVNLKKRTILNSGITMQNSLNSGLMFVSDKISRVLIGTDPTPSYKYININDYKMWNVSSDHHFTYNNWNLSTGLSLIGISQKLQTGALGTTSDDKFLYTLNVNTSLSYKLPNYNTQFSLYFKYNGKTQEFVNDIYDSSKFVLSEVNGYSWLDASVKKTFFEGKFETMIGARNLFNVIDVQRNTNSSSSGSAAHTTSNNIMLGYGRSYFVKLTYNLNF